MFRPCFLPWLLALSWLSGPSAVAATLDLAPYQGADGAISVHAGGDFVDPYFATKALLAAHEAGLDVRSAGLPWIAWALAHQRPDGRFERHRRTPSGEWQACAPADADDAMFALWLQLLYTLAPDGAFPPTWRSSLRLARSALAALEDPVLGVYRISPELPASLLMDNAEVYGALSVLAQVPSRPGDLPDSIRTGTAATHLASAIVRVFWDSAQQRFRASTQPTPGLAFYPDVVAQVYPWLAGMPTPAGDPAVAFSSWLAEYGPLWLSMQADHYPWGLVALAALKLGDVPTAYTWLRQATPLRDTDRWNVLEEAIYQGLQAQTSH